MQRRDFIQKTALTTAAVVISKYSISKGTSDFAVVRVAEAQRKFKSKAVEKLIEDVKDNIANKELAWIFENTFPNTLDTTVDFQMIDGKPDTYVITGDIDAMWLRDSAAQVWPYVQLCKEDKDLQQLIKGVINRQGKCILKDPYANAFFKDENKVSEWKKSDITEMKRAYMSVSGKLIPYVILSALHMGIGKKQEMLHRLIAMGRSNETCDKNI